MQDFFIDSPEAESIHKLSDSASADVDNSSHASSIAQSSKATVSGSDTELARTFSAIQAMISDDVINSVKAVFLFDLKGSVSFLKSYLSTMSRPCNNANLRSLTHTLG